MKKKLSTWRNQLENKKTIKDAQKAWQASRVQTAHTRRD